MTGDADHGWENDLLGHYQITEQNSEHYMAEQNEITQVILALVSAQIQTEKEITAQ